jgi:hypothetical protein
LKDPPKFTKTGIFGLKIQCTIWQPWRQLPAAWAVVAAAVAAAAAAASGGWLCFKRHLKRSALLFAL